MSASTVSITANPAASRRRPVLAGDKKSNTIELLPNEGQANGGGEVGTALVNDKVKVAPAHSKDLSHNSIRGEPILERTSKDPILLKSVAYDRSSAPKDCRVSGWLRTDVTSPADAEKMFLLAEFTYDLEKSNAQTISILDSAVSHVIDTVRLDFTSNHGSDAHTCIYRFRVHGYEPDSAAMMTLQN